MTTTRGRGRLFLALAVVALALGYLFFTGMEASQVYYLTVSEYHQQASELSADDPFRISGRVQPGSVDQSADGLDLRFTVFDPEAHGAVLPVAYHGVIPDTFMENSEVVVEGRMQEGTFQAHTLLAKCPSKYEGLADQMTEEEARRQHEAATREQPASGT